MTSGTDAEPARGASGERSNRASPPNDGGRVSDVMWAALALIVRRADGAAATHIVEHRPNGDAAVIESTVTALAQRGLVTISNRTCWPTDAGRRALGSHERREERRRARG